MNITLIGCALALGLAGLQTVRLANEQADHQKTISTYATERTNAAEALAKATDERRALESRIATAIHLNREKDRDQIAALNRRANALAASLRDRADRPAATDMPQGGDPATAGQGAGLGTGLGLYRQDGEFLVGEAARANRLRVALAACYRDYEAARAELGAH